jgi:hypothetical protein
MLKYVKLLAGAGVLCFAIPNPPNFTPGETHAADPGDDETAPMTETAASKWSSCF